MTKQLLSKLKKIGLFSLTQAKAIGINHRILSNLVKEDKLLRPARGLYLHPEAKISREIDFQIACYKFGKNSVIGGLSALFYYNLIDQVPEQTWVIVTPDKKTISKNYRIIRTKTKIDIGIIDSNSFRIVNVERALVEGFKLSSKIGERIVIKAARTAIQQKLTTVTKISKMAKELDLESSFSKFFEAIIA